MSATFFLMFGKKLCGRHNIMIITFPKFYIIAKVLETRQTFTKTNVYWMRIVNALLRLCEAGCNFSIHSAIHESHPFLLTEILWIQFEMAQRPFSVKLIVLVIAVSCVSFHWKLWSWALQFYFAWKFDFRFCFVHFRYCHGPMVHQSWNFHSTLT